MELATIFLRICVFLILEEDLAPAVVSTSESAIHSQCIRCCSWSCDMSMLNGFLILLHGLFHWPLHLLDPGSIAPPPGDPYPLHARIATDVGTHRHAHTHTHTHFFRWLVAALGTLPPITEGEFCEGLECLYFGIDDTMQCYPLSHSWDGPRRARAHQSELQFKRAQRIRSSALHKR